MSASTNLTHSQVSCVLNDIAMTARQIDCLVVRLQQALGGDDTLLPDLLAGAVGSLAQRIGWAADMAAARTPGLGAAIGDAVDWMMPSSFLDKQVSSDKVGQGGAPCVQPPVPPDALPA